ncbi:hypothetical protein DP140_27320, partial [Salmonella enterica subsp. enterica serovar Weltevreden]
MAFRDASDAWRATSSTIASKRRSASGRYSMDVEQGQYTVTLLVEGYPPSHAGVITVYDDSKPGTLN